MNFIRRTIILCGLFIFMGCSSRSKRIHENYILEVESYLNANLKVNDGNIYYFKKEFDPSFQNPNNKYIRVDCKEKFYQNLINNLGLVSSSDSLNGEALCLNSLNLSNRFWGYKGENSISLNFDEDKINWWLKKNEEFKWHYGGHYDNSQKSVIDCTNKVYRPSGRILSSYIEGKAFFLIEDYNI